MAHANRSSDLFPVPDALTAKGLTVGLARPRQVATMTGLEVVEAMGTGKLPMPPMAGVLPVVPRAWSEGEVEFRATPETRFSNPMGTVHGGWAMTLLDTAMGVACHSTLQRGETYASIDTPVRFVRPILERHGEMRVFGRVLSRGRTVVVCEGRIEDAAGKLYATGTSSCMVTTLAPPARAPSGEASPGAASAAKGA